MKKLTVIVKPANREDVIDIMESCAVYGVMETDITGYGNQKGYRVMYRGTMSGPNVLMKCKFETWKRSCVPEISETERFLSRKWQTSSGFVPASAARKHYKNKRQ